MAAIYCFASNMNKYRYKTIFFSRKTNFFESNIPKFSKS